MEQLLLCLTVLELQRAWLLQQCDRERREVEWCARMLPMRSARCDR